MRVAIIGAGISGIAAARVFLKFGHDVVVFERGPTLGGVWAVAYPEVRLQNIAEHYRLGDFPWPFTPDLHPTREQILRYLGAAVARFGIDVRPRHEVVAMVEAPLALRPPARGSRPAPRDEMERLIAQIQGWKQEHVLFEPSRAVAVSTRFHQYFDVLLGDLGLSRYRKANPVSEMLAPYTAGDYAGILDEYERSRGASTPPRHPLPVAT